MMCILCIVSVVQVNLYFVSEDESEIVTYASKYFWDVACIYLCGECTFIKRKLCT